MRRVEGRVFDCRKLIPHRQLESAKFDARQWAKEDARTEVLRGMTQHYKGDFPRAMEHVVRWRELETPWNIWPDQQDAPDYLPDLEIIVLVIVEGFDV